MTHKESHPVVQQDNGLDKDGSSGEQPEVYRLMEDDSEVKKDALPTEQPEMNLAQKEKRFAELKAAWIENGKNHVSKESKAEARRLRDEIRKEKDEQKKIIEAVEENNAHDERIRAAKEDLNAAYGGAKKKEEGIMTAEDRSRKSLERQDQQKLAEEIANIDGQRGGEALNDLVSLVRGHEKIKGSDDYTPGQVIGGIRELRKAFKDLEGDRSLPPSKDLIAAFESKNTITEAG